MTIPNQNPDQIFTYLEGLNNREVSLVGDRPTPISGVLTFHSHQQQFKITKQDLESRFYYIDEVHWVQGATIKIGL